MNVLRKIGHGLVKIEHAFEIFADYLVKIFTKIMGFFVFAIFALVITQVFFRYVLHRSMGGIEELPTYIMAMCAWMAAPVTTVRENHVTVDLIPNLFKGRGRLAFTMFNNLVAFLSMSFFTKLAYEYVAYIRPYGEVTGGVGIPIWCFHAAIAVGSTMVAFFSFANLVKNIRRFVTWESNS